MLWMIDDSMQVDIVIFGQLDIFRLGVVGLKYSALCSRFNDNRLDNSSSSSSWIKAFGMIKWDQFHGTRGVPFGGL